MKSLPVLMMLFICAGCMSEKKIDSVLAELPSYMRQNIGIVEYEPFSPLGLFFAGQVLKNDPSATIYLFALADKTVLKHEAFHSFELLAMNNRPKEWKEYCECMGETKTGLSPILSILTPIPLQWLPSKTSATLYGETNHFEDGAEVFVHHRPERKWDCVRRFVHGEQ